MKAENKDTIYQLDHLKITAWRVLESGGHTDQSMHLKIVGEVLKIEEECS